MVAALVVLDLLPVALTSTLRCGTGPAVVELILIPVLLTAATLDRRLFRAQLVAGCLVGVTIMVIGVDPASGSSPASATCCSWWSARPRPAGPGGAGRAVRQWPVPHGRAHRAAEPAWSGRPFPESCVRAESSGSTIGMVMIDIDHFSRLNAEHGHAYGDAVLRALCRGLGLPEIANGLVARIGGEELVIVVPGRPSPRDRAAGRDRAGPVHPGSPSAWGSATPRPEIARTPRPCGGWSISPTPRCTGPSSPAGTGSSGQAAGATTAVPGTVVPRPGRRHGGGQPPRAPAVDPRPVGRCRRPAPGPSRPPADVGDDRLFGAYCLVFTVIGASARHLAWRSTPTPAGSGVHGQPDVDGALGWSPWSAGGPPRRC